LTPAPVTSTHYGDPKLGCLSDEMEVQIQGLGGDFCTSSCGLFKRCPPDVPDGVSAKPQCTLKESGTMKEFCALICAPEEAVANGVIVDQAVADAQCGDNASCKVAGVGVGLCTYDD